jgi:hypothetical protein
MNIKLQLNHLIENVEKLSHVLRSIQNEAETKHREDRVKNWRPKLELWLQSLRELAAHSDIELFDLKAIAWGHHFSNLSRIFDSSLSWSDYEEEYDKKFTELYTAARILAAGADVRSIPIEAAPKV